MLAIRSLIYIQQTVPELPTISTTEKNLRSFS